MRNFPRNFQATAKPGVKVSHAKTSRCNPPPPPPPQPPRPCANTPPPPYIVRVVESSGLLSTVLLRYCSSWFFMCRGFCVLSMDRHHLVCCHQCMDEPGARWVPCCPCGRCPLPVHRGGGRTGTCPESLRRRRHRRIFPPITMALQWKGRVWVLTHGGGGHLVTAPPGVWKCAVVRSWALHGGSRGWRSQNGWRAVGSGQRRNELSPPTPNGGGHLFSPFKVQPAHAFQSD